MSFELKPKPGPVKADRDYLQADYTTTITVLYDIQSDLYLLVDNEGSTQEKLTPSELEERVGEKAGQTIHRRFQAALKKPKAKAGKKASKKAGKKASKKAGKKSSSRKPPRAVAVPSTGRQSIVLDAAGGKLTISKDYDGETGWQYKDQWGSGPVWIREPAKGDETWEIMLPDGTTRDFLEVGEADQLGIYVPPRLRDRAAPAPPKKKGLMQRLFGK